MRMVPDNVNRFMLKNKYHPQTLAHEMNQLISLSQYKKYKSLLFCAYLSGLVSLYTMNYDCHVNNTNIS